MSVKYKHPWENGQSGPWCPRASAPSELVHRRTEARSQRALSVVPCPWGAGALRGRRLASKLLFNPKPFSLQSRGRKDGRQRGEAEAEARRSPAGESESRAHGHRSQSHGEPWPLLGRRLHYGFYVDAHSFRRLRVREAGAFHGG